jgi:tetratricopeptide (TPR) repeat protein
MRRGVVIGVVIAVALTGASYAATVPPIPDPSVDGFNADVRQAVVEAHKLAVAEPASGKATGHLGMVLQAYDLYAPAALAYQRAVQLEPDEFAWRYYLAVALHQQSQLDQALDAIAAALRLRSSYAPALLEKGELLFLLGRFPESGIAYQSVLAQDPGAAAALYGLAKVRSAQKDYAAAVDFYGRACQAYPAFGAAYYGLALAERSLGHDVESARDFDLARRYVNQAPPREDAVYSQVVELAKESSYNQLQRADLLLKNGKKEESARLYEDFLLREPENLPALSTLIYLARYVKRIDDSQVDALYAKATKVNPELAVVHNNYGATMLMRGRYEPAAAALLKAIELNPNFTEAHMWLGQVREKQHRMADAAEQFRITLALQPADTLAQFHLGNTLINMGRDREAIPQLEPLLTALSADDSHLSLVMVLLGEARRRTGDPTQARRLLEQARSRVRSAGPPELLAEIERELAKLSLP